MSGGSRTEVLDWLCGTLIDRILQAGDHLVICVAQERPQVLFDKLILGEDQKNEAKNLVQNIQYAGKTVNYAASLREAARRSIDSRTISYTLLIGGTEMRVSPASTEANVAELLKYSKTDAFSGWKLITVGLGIDSRAGRAAASYMNRFN
jgi:hypothetical protein